MIQVDEDVEDLALECFRNLTLEITAGKIPKGSFEVLRNPAETNSTPFVM